MRLDKYISQVTDFSRKEVKALLKSGRITVDHDVVSDPSTQVSEGHLVQMDNDILSTPAPRYFMLNKPVGYVCATKDSRHPVVLDLLDEPNKSQLQIAGRLDIDTTGMVLITDDGAWNHAITSPNRDCRKRYYVCTADNIEPAIVDKFRKGIFLQGENKRTRPADLELLFRNEARLAISEGKYHQVKRMFGALGNRVVELHREAIGNIELDPELAEGDYRALTPEEVDSVWQSQGQR
jgi:16S rRNA pseudouridine516 synthase